MGNIAYIYQPHFKTNCFRVAMDKQRGTMTNFIVVTCSPSYNGIWKYDASNIELYDDWFNNNLICKCVPIADCTFVKPLEQVENADILNKIKLQQNKWLKNQIKNRNYEYASKPEWLLI